MSYNGQISCQPFDGVGDRGNTMPIDNFQNSGSTQMSHNDSVAFCQPVSDNNKPSLNNEDVNSFIQWAARAKGESGQLAVPLREWFCSEGHITCQSDERSPHSQLNQKRAGLLRKITVGYAIGKLLQHIKASVASYSQEELLRLCCVGNFSVHMSTEVACEGEEGWDVIGLDMISPPLSLQVTPTSFDGNGGKDVEIAVTRHSPFCCAKRAAQDGQEDDSSICYALGVLLRALFSGENKPGNGNPQTTQNFMGDFLRALSISPEDGSSNNSPGPSDNEASRPTKSIRMPSQTNEVNLSHSFMSGPVSQIVGDLLECKRGNDLFRLDSAYKSLDSAIHDMHLLLLQPNKFLFETNCHLKAVTNIYGRSSETTSLLNAFCRVGSTGQSEAFVVKGFSGSGKTRLVRNLLDSVVAANGLFVNKKFEGNSTNQLSLVLSAFDDVCILLLESDQFTKEGTQYLWHQFLSEFGSNIYMLIRTVPSVVRLAPNPAAALAMQDQNREGNVNFFSLCDMIKRFMRAISSVSRPVVLFLDDLQWADSVSLALVHTVLSDKKGASSMFFVGSYRENEVSENHQIHGFQNWLSGFNVPINSIHLDGMPEDDVNSLVSDSLGMLPRLCQSLSQVVFRKTKGNPFFVQTFLRSLVGKNLLKYCLRERSWVWDIDEIYAEKITPNVLDLLASKMAVLSENVQSALKVASCFGIKMDVSIAHELSTKLQFSSLLEDLNKAVEDGLMDLDVDSERSCYRFVHDKVLEAAYDLIGPEDKCKYHFDIGMELLSSYETQVEKQGGILFAILNQINHGVPSLLCSDSQRISIAKLNYEAASEALGCYNYTMAYQLSKTATSLLPDDCWSVHYDLSLKFCFLLSKAAYSCGEIDEAKEALCKVVGNANSLQTKLDAYTLQHSILFNVCAPKEMGQLLVTIVDVLKSLGEHIPDNISEKETVKVVHSATESFKRETDDSLLQTYTTGSNTNIAIMQAYNILVNLAYVAKPKLYPYFVARWSLFHLQNKSSCIYVSAAYVTFAVVLCFDMGSEDIRQGHRIGKLALRMLNQCDSSLDLLPAVHLLYYGHVGILFEPIQACIDMHRKAYDIGYQVGNVSIAALHKQFLIGRQLHSGTNLNVLKEEIELEIKTTDHKFSFPMLGTKMPMFYDAILALIGNESTQPSSKPNELVFDQEITHITHQIIYSTYLGQYERAVHMFKRWEQLSGENENKKIAFRGVYMRFYYGLSLIGMRRKKSAKATRIKVSQKDWLDVVKNAAEYSHWNFSNKASLLMAEKLSLSSKNRDAEAEYDAAIKGAQSSKFVHEEGLACELAGMHHERLGNNKRALELFTQAEYCYEAWGSKVKTRQMTEKVRQNSAI